MCKKSISLLILIFLFLFATKLLSQVNQTKKINIVFILADDCTNWDIGCYGSKDSKTPNIDKLASEGIQFNRCYQSAPMCTPTRHNIYTGMYPVKTGAYPNHSNAYPDTKSIVQYLKPLGYRVAISGKKDIGPVEAFPFEDIDKIFKPASNSVEGFLKNVKETKEPFALMICSHEPHEPWDKGDAKLFNPETISLPPNSVDTKETREAYCRYLAEINYLDEQVGNAIALIGKYGFKENTLVIFASEQGNSFPFNKWSLYEAGVKSALIARLPGVIKSGIQSEAIVEYNDLLPTFIDLAGGKIPQNLDGKSMLPLFNNPKGTLKDYSFSIQTTRGISRGSDYYGSRAVVNDKYRYIWNLTPEVEFKNIINNPKPDEPLDPKTTWYNSWVERAKVDAFAQSIITKNKKRPKEELYDVINDKWCLNNLADHAEYTKIKEGLRIELLKWMKNCGDKGQETELEAFKHMPRRKSGGEE
jgi:N-sulfoglucosamine sulfohydrolase